MALLHTVDVNPIPDKRSIVVYLSMYFLHLRDDKSDVHVSLDIEMCMGIALLKT